jgi:hypothetical protein
MRRAPAVSFMARLILIMNFLPVDDFDAKASFLVIDSCHKKMSAKSRKRVVVPQIVGEAPGMGCARAPPRIYCGKRKLNA